MVQPSLLINCVHVCQQQLDKIFAQALLRRKNSVCEHIYKDNY